MNEVLQTSLLQAKQPQLPQPVFVGEALQSFYQLHVHLLDLLQKLYVLPMLGTQELYTALQVWGHKSRVEGEYPLPCPAGHIPTDGTQDSFDFLCWESALLAHVELFISHHTT